MQHYASPRVMTAVLVLALGFTGSIDASAHEVALAHSTTTMGDPEGGHSAELPFLAENAAAMGKMMAGMDVKPTGDVDTDFAAMMIPHHQGAIEMALAELRYGKKEQLRRIAQEIVVEQQQEIIAMRMALGQTLPPSTPAPTQVNPTQAADAAVHDRSSMPRRSASTSPSTKMKQEPAQ